MCMSNIITEDLIPILVPKRELKKLIKGSEFSKKDKKKRSIESMTKEQIMQKLHQTRRKLLKERSGEYIDYSSR